MAVRGEQHSEADGEAYAVQCAECPRLFVAEQDERTAYFDALVAGWQQGESGELRCLVHRARRPAAAARTALPAAAGREPTSPAVR